MIIWRYFAGFGNVYYLLRPFATVQTTYKWSLTWQSNNDATTLRPYLQRHRKGYPCTAASNKYLGSLSTYTMSMKHLACVAYRYCYYYTEKVNDTEKWILQVPKMTHFKKSRLDTSFCDKCV